MEEVPGKSMYLRIFDNDPIKTDTARTWTVQLIEGVKKMHEVGVAHRFLKLQHVLFNKSDHVKIAGWSKAVPFWEPSKNKALLQRKERRSRKNSHLPPECFRQTYDPSRVDIWSIGVIMVRKCDSMFGCFLKYFIKFRLVGIPSTASRRQNSPHSGVILLQPTKQTN